MIRFNIDKNAGKSSLQLTSLIDVLFILLIFFMISSTFIKPVVRLKLPVATIREQQPRKKKAVVVLTADNRIYVDRRLVTLDSLEAYAAKLARDTPDINILFYGDEHIKYRNFMETIDRLKTAGIKKYRHQS